jgi:hypothetical protein
LDLPQLHGNPSPNQLFPGSPSSGPWKVQEFSVLSSLELFEGKYEVTARSRRTAVASETARENEKD